MLRASTPASTSGADNNTSSSSINSFTRSWKGARAAPRSGVAVCGAAPIGPSAPGERPHSSRATRTASSSAAGGTHQALGGASSPWRAAPGRLVLLGTHEQQQQPQRRSARPCGSLAGHGHESPAGGCAPRDATPGSPQQRGSRVLAHTSTKSRPASSVLHHSWGESGAAKGTSDQQQHAPARTQHAQHQQHQHQQEMPPGALPADALPLQLQQRSLVSEAFGAVATGLHASVRLNPLAGADGAAVLGLTSPEGPSSFLNLTLGKLAPGRMLACARSKLWWMTPEWRSSTRTLPPETQFLLVELKEGGPYLLLLPLIDGSFRATLRRASPEHGVEGEVTLRVESGDDNVKSEVWQSLLHVSAGWDPYALVDRGVAAAASMSGGAGPLHAKKLPPSLDVFGWCTWDAFYSSVSAKGIQDGLRKLHENGVRPRLLIIDDGWQMTALDPVGASTSAMASTPTQLAERISWLDETERQLIRSTEGEFYMESMEVLAEAAKTLPAGTSAATSMPMLSNMGQEGARVAAAHHHQDSVLASLAGGADLGPGAGTGAAGAAGEAPGSAPAAGKTRASQLIHPPSATASATKAVTKLPVLPSKPPSTKSAATQQQQQQQQPASSVSAPADTSPDALYLTRVGQKVAGWLVGLGTAAFVLAYQWLVEPAPPGSTAVQAFAALANGPLRGMMLGFYSGASDFTRRLTSVRANGKFSSPDAGPDEPWEGKPEALQQVVADLRKQYGLQYVYCWHGLPGYWAGIMPSAPEMAQYGSTVVYARPTPGVLEVEPSMAWNPAVVAGVGVLLDPKPVYSAMHKYLSGCGVDGVKVDCQAGVGLVGSALGGGPALSSRFQSALEDSIAENFTGNHAINCMCHSTENLYRMRDTAVARASDDFYPRDQASSQPHIAACAYNSMFLAALVQPDWDMFQSKHPAARLHAIARVVSGGGVYVSDKPGEHDAALLRQLVLPDGSVLRCSRPGRPTRDTLFRDVLRDGVSALKVWNVNGALPAPSPLRSTTTAAGPAATAAVAGGKASRNGTSSTSANKDAPGQEAAPSSGAGGGVGSAGAAPSGVLGVFHLQGSSWDRDKRKFYVHNPKPHHLNVQVRPSDVEALRPTTASNSHVASGTTSTGTTAAATFAVHVHGQPASALRVLGWSDPLELRLAPATAEMVRLAPLHKVGDNGVAFAALGWLHMFNGPAGVRSLSVAAPSTPSTSTSTPSTSAAVEVGLRGSGTLLLYCSQRPQVVRVCGLALMTEWHAASGALTVEVPPTLDLLASVQLDW